MRKTIVQTFCDDPDVGVDVLRDHLAGIDVCDLPKTSELADYFVIEVEIECISLSAKWNITLSKLLYCSS